MKVEKNIFLAKIRHSLRRDRGYSFLSHQSQEKNWGEIGHRSELCNPNYQRYAVQQGGLVMEFIIRTSKYSPHAY